jgi:metal-responsive CopG/Arc/MetJ family transcriptional regulator
MPNVKTAISIPAELFKEVNRYAKRKRIPRSQVFAEGARRLLKDLTDRQITERVNDVFSDPKIRHEQRAFARAASASLARFLEREGDRW